MQDPWGVFSANHDVLSNHTGYSTAVKVWKINEPIDFKQCYCYVASFDVKAITMRAVFEGVVGGFRPIFYLNPSATMV